ncbi:hypothetical protein [Actinomycetospora termitidis]|uniref:Integral membrane protein n=1 Tax=Actinomycetospora termitidis TaxID=3053470 RepID=A0ABT7MCU7_9PSEU|nr:hypothetical protein [Actinomycetospora sp. Odt1-22]MDL5158291.1 hypothetical protein [Actinomycetospora sp. Odt1-22]
MVVLAWVNVVVLAGVGGLFGIVALIPFAMANDDPASGPLVRHGLLQLVAYVGLWVWLVLGVWQASGALDAVGWSAVGVGALGWAVWVGGVVVTMAAFFGLARLDMALGRSRRRDG